MSQNSKRTKTEIEEVARNQKLLGSEMEEAKGMSKRLEKENLRMKGEARVAKEELKKKTDLVKALKSARVESEKKLQELETLLDKERSGRVKLEKESKRHSEIGLIRQKSKENEIDNQKKADELKRMKQKIQSLLADVGRKNTIILNLKKKIAKFEESISQITGENIALKQSAKGLQSDLRRKQGMVEQSKRRLRELEQEMEEIAGQSTEREEARNMQVRDQSVRLVELKRDFKELARENNLLKFSLENVFNRLQDKARVAPQKEGKSKLFLNWFVKNLKFRFLMRRPRESQKGTFVPQKRNFDSKENFKETGQQRLAPYQPKDKGGQFLQKYHSREQECGWCC